MSLFLCTVVAVYTAVHILMVNNYLALHVHCLHCMANANWSAFPECLLVIMYINPQLVIWWQWRVGTSHCHLCQYMLFMSLIVEQWLFGGSTCGCHNQTRSLMLFGFFSLAVATTYPIPHPSHPPYICASSKFMHYLYDS